MSDNDFLPYTLQVIQPLKELFSQDRFFEIPTFNLKPNSDFHLVSANMASLAITQSASEDPKQQIEQIFDNFAEYVQDSNNLPRLQALEHASKNFAATLENSYTTLTSQIAPTVSDLKAKIEDRYTKLMIKEKAEELITTQQVEPSEADYTFLEWNKLRSPTKQYEIVEAACANASITNTTLSLTNMNFVLQKMHFAGNQELKLPAEVDENVLSKLKSTLVNDTYNITEERVSHFWTLVTQPAKYAAFCTTAKSQLNDPKRLAENILFTNQQTNHFHLMLGALPRLAYDLLSPEALEIMRNNLNNLTKTTYALQYWLLSQKEIKLKDRLVLTKEVVNREVYEEFVREGHTIADIHNYLKAFYFDKSVSFTGIGKSSIASADTSMRLAKMNAKLNYNASFLRSKCLLAAYEEVLAGFAKDETAQQRYPKLKDQYATARFSNLVRTKASSLAGDLTKLDAILYDVIIKAFYQDHVVSTLYSYLGKNFDDLATGEEDVTDDAIVKSQCWATMEMLTEYLFNTLTAPTSKQEHQSAQRNPGQPTGMMSRSYV